MLDLVTAEPAGWPLLPLVTGGAALLGLLIGSFLNVVVWRVPRGESLLPASHCPRCEAPIRALQNVPVLSWLALRGRCAGCSARISARYPLVELGTALAFGLVTWWWGGSALRPIPGPIPGPPVLAWWLALAGLLWFAASAIALTLIDLDHQRLPDAIVLPSLGVVTALLAASAIVSGQIPVLISVLGGAAALFALYLLIALVYPAGIGGGDVKLAPLVGAVLGLVGWDAVVVGAFSGFLFGAVIGLALIALRRGTRKTGIPFGPCMLAGAWIGLLLGPSLMGAYLRLTGLA